MCTIRTITIATTIIYYYYLSVADFYSYYVDSKALKLKLICFHTNIPSSFLPSSLLDWLRPFMASRSRDLPAPPPRIEWTTLGGRLQLCRSGDSGAPTPEEETVFFILSGPPLRRFKSLNRSLLVGHGVCVQMNVIRG